MSDTRTPRYNDVRPVKELVTTEEAGEALALLDTTAHRAGVLDARARWLKERYGKFEAAAVLYSEETTAERRKLSAAVSKPVLEAMDAWHEALEAHLSLANQRDVATLKIELYRTLRADQRQRDMLANNNSTSWHGNSPSWQQPPRPRNGSSGETPSRD